MNHDFSEGPCTLPNTIDLTGLRARPREIRALDEVLTEVGQEEQTTIFGQLAGR